MSPEQTARRRPAISTATPVIDATTKTHIRLVGFDAPEIGRHARCHVEDAMATAAKHRLVSLLALPTARLDLVPCSCPAGTEGTALCNYGRACGRLRVDGRDAADIMVGEGLAYRYTCGPTRCQRREGWCG